MTLREYSSTMYSRSKLIRFGYKNKFESWEWLASEISTHDYTSSIILSLSVAAKGQVDWVIHHCNYAIEVWKFEFQMDVLRRRWRSDLLFIHDDSTSKVPPHYRKWSCRLFTTRRNAASNKNLCLMSRHDLTAIQIQRERIHMQVLKVQKAKHHTARRRECLV